MPSLALLEQDRQAAPVLTPASDAAQQAIAQFRAPAGFEVKLWAAEPMLSNPVAFDFDEKGRLFVSETHRYRTSVLDIRDYMAMLEVELASTSIEDRLAYTRGIFGDAAEQMAIETEVVRLVQDTDGDGVADDSRVFAEGFNGILDGIASGVLARRGEVWFTSIPSLWKFETKADGITEKSREELLRGFGIRYGFTGHDFHGLAFGPDGKLYYSIGDRSTNVTGKEGQQVAVTDQGAVFRSNPDGTEFELFAAGLRNPQELAFDEYGNLLTGDNDCDNGDLERLVHVVEGGDSGWRIGYQYAPRGRAGPWMSDGLWKPEFEGRPAYLLPPVSNIEDGPSGITYYPGTGFSSDYDRTLFITHFKGSVARSGVQTYHLEPEGASFKVTKSEQFLWGTLPTDVTFAPDGKFYFADWVEGWPKSNKGRVYSVAPADRSAAEVNLSREVQQLLASGIATASADELLGLLGHPDQRIRFEAQFELAAQGAVHIPALARLARNSTVDQFARIHAIWALGQLGEKADSAFEGWSELLADGDPEIRAQAAKLAGDHGLNATADRLAALLRDPNPRAQFMAAQSLGKVGRDQDAAALIDLLRRNDNADAYLRHAAVYALYRLGDQAAEALAAAATDESPAVRLGVILVYRRQANPAIAQFLGDPDPYLVREAALAINDAPINAALPALAAMLGTGHFDDEPLQLRQINARLRLGRPEDAVALAAYASTAAVPADLREEALTLLASWPEPFDRDRLVGVYRPLDSRDAGPAIAALNDALPQLLADASSSVQLATLAAVRELGVLAALPRIRALVANPAADGELRSTALAVLDELGDPELLASVNIAGASNSPALRMSTLPILARLSPTEALPTLTRMAEAGTPAEQQAAYPAIAELNDPAAATLLANALDRLRAGEVPYLAQFELLDAAEASSAPVVQEKLAALKAYWAAAEDKLLPYRGALAGGDARTGWRLFNQHPVLACTRCHRANGEGGLAGPDLSNIGDTHPAEYILESIIEPNAAIATGFDVVAFTLSDGGFYVGTIAEETPTEISIYDAAGEKQTFDATKVVKREGAPSSMPAIFGLVLNRTELRDLMAFVKNLRPRQLPSQNAGGEAAARATHGE